MKNKDYYWLFNKESTSKTSPINHKKITISSIMIGLKKLLFFTNSLATLLLDSLLLDSLLSDSLLLDSLLSDSLLLDSLLSDSSISQSHSKL